MKNIARCLFVSLFVCAFASAQNDPMMTVTRTSGSPPFNGRIGIYTVEVPSPNAHIAVTSPLKNLTVKTMVLPAKGRKGWCAILDEAHRLWICDGVEELFVIRYRDANQPEVVDALARKIPIPQSVRQNLPQGFTTFRQNNVL